MWGTQGVFQGASQASMPTFNQASAASSDGSGMSGLQVLSSLTKGLGSIGDYMSLRGSARAYDYQAGMLDLEAGSVTQSGIEKAGVIRKQGNTFIARQKAIYAKSGVRFEGSPADIYRQTEKMIAQDVLKTRLNAVQDANKLRMQATWDRLRAGQARTRSIMALGKGILNMGSSLAMAGGE